MSAPEATSNSSNEFRPLKPRKSVSGLIVKYTILSLMSAIGIFAIYLMLINHLYWQPIPLAIAIVGINWLYMTERLVPLKYLLPGTITMAIFGVLPIIYSIYIAFTNYGTGHEVSKMEAVEAITRDGYYDFDSFTVQVADGPEGRVYLLERYDDQTSEDLGSFIGTKDGIKPAPAPFVLNDMNVYEPIPPAGYTAVDDDTVDKQIQKGQAFQVPLEDGRKIYLDSSHTGFERTYRWIYDEKTGNLTDVGCGNVFKDNHYGAFQGIDCETNEDTKLATGWMVPIGLDNFRHIFGEHRYSDALWRVFLWTIVYAFSSVFLTFTCGLAVALLFNVPKMRMRKLYRGLLIIPYAIPGFLSLLVWRGLLHETMGPVNAITGWTIPWLTDPNWAKISILLVNTWLGFPYMFLVGTGALQAIPSELKEAAAVDGATRWQIFRNVTLPLLLVAVGPLLVGSFSFNFNNFNQIYLLTGGGPALQNNDSAAGATDILISYTYKLSFASGAGNNYGLSAAVSILLFFIVGAMSFWSFRRSKALENMS